MDEGGRAEAPQSGSTGGGSLSWIGWTLFFLLIVYPLSVGPAAKVFGPSPPAAVRGIYFPLGYLNEHSKPVRSFYVWYAKLWGVHL